MIVSVIICTYNRVDPIQDCLDSLIKQTRPPDEVIIVDASDTQPLPALLRYRYGNGPLQIRYFYSRPPQLTRQRNEGIQASRGDIIFFFDDDVVLEPDYIEQVMRVYEEDTEGVVGGVQGTLTNVNSRMGWKRRLLMNLFMLDGPGDGRVLPSGFQRWVAYGESRYLSMHQPLYIEVMSGCIMSYRRIVVDEFKFDERFPTYGGEDQDFSYRVSRKYRLCYTPLARAEHHSDPLGRLGLGNYYYQSGQSHVFLFFNAFVDNPLNWLAFGWSILGRMIFLLVYYRSMDAVKGLLLGYMEGIKINSALHRQR